MKKISLASLSLLLFVVGLTWTFGQDKPSSPRKQEKMDAGMMGMTSHHEAMGLHMKMTTVRPRRPGDQQRANEVVRTARRVLDKYKDYKVALADGFEIFMPNEPQRMYHFTNYRYGIEAVLRFNPEHPPSLLYEKEGDGYRLIGAMYTASANLSEADLDKRIPLSFAQWHQHVNFCIPPVERRAEIRMANPRFGLLGSIATKEECDRAGGTFVPRLFGWMVHVYPFERTNDDIWSVDRQMQDMMMPAAPAPATSGGDKIVKTARGDVFRLPKTALPTDASIRQSSVTFKSDDKEISSELFEPVKPGTYPIIILLYGSGGMDVGGPMFQAAAQSLAHQGFVVYLPHYFDKTGTRFAKFEDDQKYFATWLKTVADAIDYATRQPNVDARRLGLAGFSLGAYLSLALASVDRDVKAVVEYFGGLPEFFAGHMETMPPTLILHGAADRIVPVNEAYKLEALFKSKNVPYEIKIYPQQGHGFFGADGEDALKRTLSFFDRNLKK